MIMLDDIVGENEMNDCTEDLGMHRKWSQNERVLQVAINRS